MNKAELIVLVANQTNISRAQARDTIEAITANITTALQGGSEVRIVGFGAFVPIDRPAGPTRNPRTGKMVHRDATRTVRFRMGEALKAAMN